MAGIRLRFAGMVRKTAIDGCHVPTLQMLIEEVISSDQPARMKCSDLLSERWLAVKNKEDLPLPRGDKTFIYRHLR